MLSECDCIRGMGIVHTHGKLLSLFIQGQKNTLKNKENIVYHCEEMILPLLASKANLGHKCRNIIADIWRTAHVRTAWEFHQNVKTRAISVLFHISKIIVV